MKRLLDQLGPADEGVLIGIVDGIPDLQCASLKDCGIRVEQSMMPADDYVADVHGTEICSVIFGHPPDALGLARGCSGLMLPIFFPRNDSDTTRFASQMDLARALTLAVKQGAAIVNVSAGQLSATAEAGRHLEDALALCEQSRVLVVAAAGNDGCACLHVPAAVQTTLAVGAMDDKGMPHDASNWGDSYATHGLLAPGVDIPVVGPGNQAGIKTGTSIACAVVSAMAARLLSEARNVGHDLDALDIRSILLASADPCNTDIENACQRVLAGRLNVDAAVQMIHDHKASTDNSPLQSSHRPSTSARPEIIPMNDITQAVEPPPISPHEVMQPPPADQGLAQASVDTTTVDVTPLASDAVHRNTAQTPTPAQTATTAAALTQQSCGCGGDQSAHLVYAIGSLWFDFGTEARYDALVQAIGDPTVVNNPTALFAALSKDLALASGITLLLMQDQVPVYAIQPAGTFALDIYKMLLDELATSVTVEEDERLNSRVVIPGINKGVTRLMNGMTLPILYPDKRGIVKLSLRELATCAVDAATDTSAQSKPSAKDKDAITSHVSDFLVRVWDGLRNLGLSAEERALNHAATNAFQAAGCFAAAVAVRHLELCSVEVSKSPICRPDSDCWDVQLKMFDPENERRAGRIYRLTVDVSEVIPVTVGPIRDWAAPLSQI